MAAIGSATASARPVRKKVSFMESQRRAKQKAFEKQKHKKKIGLNDVCIFTQQLGSMLTAGLPLVSALEALQEQTEHPVFQIIIREVRIDVSGGTNFSDAVRKFPNAFPNLFISMVEAGEASGGLAEILGQVAGYFEKSVALMKKVKSAMTYPVSVIALSACLVCVLLIKVIPVFEEMFSDFGAALPAPTQFLIDLSHFLQSYIILILVGGWGAWKLLMKVISTPKGRVAKDQVLFRLPIVGNLTQKINLSRFCRTYAILMRSGVPILRSLEITAAASGSTFIEKASVNIARNIGQGGQLSDSVANDPYFPPMVKHMAKAGEQTGNVDGMMEKISDFYDVEIDAIVDSLTSLMEPLLICVLGVIIGGIVMAMFLPIFQMSSVVSS